MLPDGAPWTTGFVQRLKTFTGLDGGVDDEADALVSVCDGNWEEASSLADFERSDALGRVR